MAEFGSDVSAPWHMWALGGLLLLWNGLATVDYVMTVIRYEPYLASYPDEVLAYFFEAPLWMYVMWGVSMIGGFISTVLLLLRRRIAVLTFAIAWVCSVVAVIYSAVNPVPEGGSILLAVSVIIITFLLLIYVYWLQRRGVLR